MEDQGSGGTYLRPRLRHRHQGESRRQQRLPRPQPPRPPPTLPYWASRLGLHCHHSGAAGESPFRAHLFAKEGSPPLLPHLLGEALQPHQVAQPFLDSLEVLPEKSPAYVLLLSLNDPAPDEEPQLVHASTLTTQD